MLGEHPFTWSTTVLVLAQLGLGLSGGLFNRTGVVILVSSQCRTARECLLTVGVRAFIGALSGVNTTMSCQRGRVTERLQAC
jgi:hypothetical protein